MSKADSIGLTPKLILRQILQFLRRPRNLFVIFISTSFVAFFITYALLPVGELQCRLPYWLPLDISVSNLCHVPIGTLTALKYSNKYGLCTSTQGKPIIWVFWDYAPMPAYIQVSLQVLKCQNENFAHVEVLNEKSFRQFMSQMQWQIHPAFPYLSNIHKTDYIRCFVLLAFGGLWTDLDVIAWKPLHGWFQYLAEGYDLFGFRMETEHSDIGGGNLLGPVRANSTLYKEWYRRSHCKLDWKLSHFQTGKYPLYWQEILRDALHPIASNLLRDKNFRYKQIDGKPIDLVIKWFGIEELFKKKKSDDEDILRRMAQIDTPMFILCCQKRFYKFANETVADFLSSGGRLANIYLTALKRCHY